MLREYGIVLGDALWGPEPLGVRRLTALVAGLPPAGSLGRDLDPFLAAGWDSATELTAMVAELVDHSNRMYLMANSKKGTRLPPPLFIPRPGQPRRRRKPTKAELKASLGRLGVPIVKRKKETSGS